MDENKKMSAGRPPLDRQGRKRQLVIWCTDEEWAGILDGSPKDTRERYELLAELLREKNE